MEYMLMFCENEAELARSDNPAEAPAYWGAWNAYIGALVGSGIVRGGNGLQPPRSATTVRVIGGQRQIQDGPFADTREHLGGSCTLRQRRWHRGAARHAAPAGRTGGLMS